MGEHLQSLQPLLPAQSKAFKQLFHPYEVVRLVLSLQMPKQQYKKLVSWGGEKTPLAQEVIPRWRHPFASYNAMHVAWEEPVAMQKLEDTVSYGRVGVHWQLTEFLDYFECQQELLAEMEFLGDDEELVLMIRGDGPGQAPRSFARDAERALPSEE